MKNKIFKLLRKGTEAAGETAGSALRGAAKGVYKGATGLTDQDIENRRLKYELDRKILKKAAWIRNWIYLFSIAAICSISLYFLGESDLNPTNLIDVISLKWPYYAVVFIVNVFAMSFSHQIAKEITN